MHGMVGCSSCDLMGNDACAVMCAHAVPHSFRLGSVKRDWFRAWKSAPTLGSAIPDARSLVHGE